MKLRIGLFFGGKSVEHEVSVISALQAKASLSKEKYDVIPVYITKNGEMYTDGGVGDIDSYKDIPALLRTAVRVNLINDCGKFYLYRYPAKKFGDNRVRELDIALPIVHGTNVEDGAFQGFLQTVGIPYAGCDVLSSAVGMDKAVTKAVLGGSGVNTLPCLCFRLTRFLKEREKVVSEIAAAFKYPVIIKPVNLGSSVGIKIARDAGELAGALEHGFMFSTTVIAEPALTDFYEINCSVAGDCDSASASECERPVSSGEILNYDDKYKGGGKGKISAGSTFGKHTGVKGGMASLKRVIPADIPDTLRTEIRRLAVTAFKRLECSGVARIDFLVDNVTGTVYFNEINTIPGSLSYYLWEPLGVSYAQLLDKIIELSLKREKEKRAVNFSFDTDILKDFGGFSSSKAGKE